MKKFVTSAFAFKRGHSEVSHRGCTWPRGHWGEFDHCVSLHPPANHIPALRPALSFVCLSVSLRNAAKGRGVGRLVTRSVSCSVGWVNAYGRVVWVVVVVCGLGLGGGDGGNSASEFLSKHSARGFVFIAPLLLLISLRRVLQLRGWGPESDGGEVRDSAGLMRSDTGSRSAKHPPEFNRSRAFSVSALHQRSLPANQNTSAQGGPLPPVSLSTLSPLALIPFVGV